MQFLNHSVLTSFKILDSDQDYCCSNIEELLSATTAAAMLMQQSPPLQSLNSAVLSNLTTSAAASVGSPAFQQLPCCPTQLTATPNYHFAVCPGAGSAGVCLPSPNQQSRVYLGSMSLNYNTTSRSVYRQVYFNTVHSQL